MDTIFINLVAILTMIDKTIRLTAGIYVVDIFHVGYYISLYLFMLRCNDG